MFALNIAQFLQKTFEIIHVWTIFFSVTTCTLTMLQQSIVAPYCSSLYRLLRFTNSRVYNLHYIDSRIQSNVKTNDLQTIGSAAEMADTICGPPCEQGAADQTILSGTVTLTFDLSAGKWCYQLRVQCGIFPPKLTFLSPSVLDLWERTGRTDGNKQVPGDSRIASLASDLLTTKLTN